LVDARRRDGGGAHGLLPLQRKRRERTKKEGYDE
jgi:hypothetical protein